MKTISKECKALNKHVFTDKECTDLKYIEKLSKALNHPIKKKIIQMLSDHKEMTVTDIHIMLRVDQSVGSQHTLPLEKLGIVISETKGRFYYKSLNWEKIYSIKQGIDLLTD